MPGDFVAHQLRTTPIGQQKSPWFLATDRLQ